MNNTPQMRNLENKGEKERRYQDGLVEAFIIKYAELTK